MNRCRDDIESDRARPRMRRKYASMWSFARAWSSCPPIVLRSLHSASTSSSSGFFVSPRSFIMHVCMMRSVSICFLKSSPMNLMLPSILRRAIVIRSSRSSCFRRSVSSFSAADFSFLISPSSRFSSPAAPASSASPVFPLAASMLSCSTALIAASPFSNSSWHLFRRTRLNVILFGSATSGSDSGSRNSIFSDKKRSLRC
mmetsp:Transcript_6358/g.23287  ORF Transcript_6358/g.23287 Transcript_6358/m.23287 type:complete len:201 (+) Transcript_6358:1788-2390(+)